MLDNEKLTSINNGLRSNDKKEILDTCRLIPGNVSSMSPQELRSVTDALMSFFYHDDESLEDFREIAECASDSIATMGADTVEVLIEGLTDADLQANLFISETLAKIGAPAIAVLKVKFQSDPDPYTRAMALLALSKIDDPALLDVFSEVVSAMDHENGELRSMAVQAIGRIIGCVGGLCIAPDVARETFEKLVKKVADPHAGTRARAISGIGKLAENGYLDDDQVKQAVALLERVLGIDEKHSWDRAFIVRREAEETYKVLTGELPKLGDSCDYYRE